MPSPIHRRGAAQERDSITLAALALRLPIIPLRWKER